MMSASDIPANPQRVQVSTGFRVQTLAHRQKIAR
jgi:hypothetical protein